MLSASQPSPGAGRLLVSGPCCQRVCPGRPLRAPLRPPADSAAGCCRRPGPPSSGRQRAPLGPPCLGSALQGCRPHTHRRPRAAGPCGPGPCEAAPGPRAHSARAHGPPPPSGWQQEVTWTPLQLCPCQRTGGARAPPSCRAGPRLEPHALPPGLERAQGAVCGLVHLVSDSPGVRSWRWHLGLGPKGEKSRQRKTVCPAVALKAESGLGLRPTRSRSRAPWAAAWPGAAGGRGRAVRLLPGGGTQGCQPVPLPRATSCSFVCLNNSFIEV